MKKNQIITMKLMRWEVDRNGLLSPRAGDVYSGAFGYPLTMDAAESIRRSPRRWPNPVTSTALGAFYFALAPERLAALPSPANLGTGKPNQVTGNRRR